MILHKQMVWGEEAEKHRFELTWRLSHNRYPKKGYLLVLPREGSGSLLELIPFQELKKAEKYCPVITAVGFAGDKEEAVCLAAAVIEAIYRLTGAFDIKGFFNRG